MDTDPNGGLVGSAGKICFTSGAQNESAGLFGVISPLPGRNEFAVLGTGAQEYCSMPHVYAGRRCRKAGRTKLHLAAPEQHAGTQAKIAPVPSRRLQT